MAWRTASDSMFGIRYSIRQSCLSGYLFPPLFAIAFTANATAPPQLGQKQRPLFGAGTGAATARSFTASCSVCCAASSAGLQLNAACGSDGGCPD